MNNLQEIFNRIEDREWDWFGSRTKGHYEINHPKLEILIEKDGNFGWRELKIIDLLANKSWCMAVWGEEMLCYDCGRIVEKPKQIGCLTIGTGTCSCNRQFENNDEAWEYHSVNTFRLLRYNEKHCIDYILKTML